jgi:biopolymer transport protein ExbD
VIATLATRMLGSRRRPADRDLGSAPRPQLTSLVDLMVILLVFLLKSFSVEGQLVTPATDLQLPTSQVRQAARPALSVEVTTAGINVDGVRVAPLPTAANDSLVIAPLQRALVDLRPDGPLTAAADDDHARRVNVQCDQRVGFAVLKRVLATCNRAGYGDLSLLVLKEGA